MWKEAINQVKTGVILLVLLTILTGLIYPLIVTGFAQLFFPWQANGSLIEKDGKTIGSLLIGQSFTDVKYFWSRPSATSPFPYNAVNSSGSNMGPSNPNFLETVKERAKHLYAVDLHHIQLIPVELVTASGSGLDPDISPLAALYQVQRVAKARNIPEQDLKDLIKKLTQVRTLGVLGEPRVNVLQLNIELDNLGSNDVRPTSKS